MIALIVNGIDGKVAEDAVKTASFMSQPEALAHKGRVSKGGTQFL